MSQNRDDLRERLERTETLLAALVAKQGGRTHVTEGEIASVSGRALEVRMDPMSGAILLRLRD